MLFRSLGLLLLLLLLLFAWLFRNCHGGCARGVNGVVDADRIVNAAGDSIDDNGIVRPIELDDGRLPEDQAIVAPVLGEGGELPPIERNPGVPPPGRTCCHRPCISRGPPGSFPGRTG